MRIGILLRNEWIKSSRRLAFWVTLIIFGGLQALIFGEQWARARDNPEASFALPEAWGAMLSEVGPLAGLFGSVALILLVASEFTNRTARQNVIDGLAKREFWLGKMLLFPLLMLGFVAVQITVGGIFAGLGTDALGANVLPGPRDLTMMLGVYLCALGYGALAFASAFATRASGAAMGIYFLYIAFVEQVAGSLLGYFGESAGELARYLPTQIFNLLFVRVQYDPQLQAQRIQQAVEAGETAPEFLANPLVFSVALGWILVFVLVGFVAYDRRDL